MPSGFRLTEETLVTDPNEFPPAGKHDFKIDAADGELYTINSAGDVNKYLGLPAEFVFLNAFSTVMSIPIDSLGITIPFDDATGENVIMEDSIIKSTFTGTINTGVGAGLELQFAKTGGVTGVVLVWSERSVNEGVLWTPVDGSTRRIDITTDSRDPIASVLGLGPPIPDDIWTRFRAVVTSGSGVSLESVAAGVGPPVTPIGFATKLVIHRQRING